MGKPFTDYPDDHKERDMAGRQDEPAVDPMMRAAETAVSADREKNLGLKLAEIMLEVGANMPRPEGHNRHFDYDFYKDAQVMGMYRQKLAQRGIIIVPEVQETSIREGRTAKGGATWLTTIKVGFTIWDGHTKEMITGIGIGQGDDPGDKGSNKAFTGAMKFFLMKLFMVGGEADPEADERTDERAVGDSRGRPAGRDEDDDRSRSRGRDRDERGRDDDRGRRDDDRRRDEDEDRTPVVVGDSNIEGIQRGGRANKATDAQLKEVRELARDLGWKPADVAKECDRLGLDELELDDDPEQAGPQLVNYLESLRSTEIGELAAEMRRLVDRRRSRGDD